MRIQRPQHPGYRGLGYLIEINLTGVVVLCFQYGFGEVIGNARSSGAISLTLTCGSLTGVRTGECERQHERKNQQPVSLFEFHSGALSCQRGHLAAASGLDVRREIPRDSTRWTIGKQL